MKRRDLLRALMAMGATALAGCSGGGSSVSSTEPGSGPFDVAIVGAGMAGLAAARAFQAAGRTNLVVLEAQDRIGGRARSANGFVGSPVDLGAEWFIWTKLRGGGGTNNPLFDDAAGRYDELGMIPDLVDRVFYQETQPAPLEPSAEAALLILAFNAAVDAAGLATLLDPVEFPDVSVRTATAELQGLPWYDFARGLVTAERGATADALGCLDIYRNTKLGDAIALPSDENWLIQSGMGNYVASYAQGVPIRTNTPVTAIDWSGFGVRLTTPAGVVEARTVIVTVPVAVLAAGRPTFTPSLPPGHLAALQGIPMSHVEKIFLRFDGDVFGPDLEAHTMVSRLEDSLDTTALRVKVWGENCAEVILGGTEDPAVNPTTLQLAQQGPDALIAAALDRVARHFPAARSRFVSGITSDWCTNPYQLGAVSLGLVGANPLRDALRQTVGDRVFFAGEAVGGDPHGGLPGAYESGRAAAAGVLRALVV